MSFKRKGTIRRLFKKVSVPSSADDLIFLESNDVNKIRKKLSKDFNTNFMFRWRNHPQEDISVIHYAAARGSIKAISCLAEYCNDLNTQTKVQGLNAVHFAVLFSNIDVIEELVNRGADINAREYGRGFTPLHYACERKNLGAVKRLLDLLADQDIRDVYGRTPLIVSKGLNSKQICKLFKDVKEADELKSNVGFLASEQRKQKENFDVFQDQVIQKFKEFDTWKENMETRMDKAEKYQQLRRSMRDAKSNQPIFYQNLSSSTSPSVDDLVMGVNGIDKQDMKRVNLNKNKFKSLSVKNLVDKFERLHEYGSAPLTTAMSLTSVHSSSSSELDSGLSSRPCSRFSDHAEIESNTTTLTIIEKDLHKDKAWLIHYNMDTLIDQMIPTDVIKRLHLQGTITKAMFQHFLSLPHQHQQNEQLLIFVINSGLITIAQFIQALEETGQGHLANMIRHNTTPYIYV